VRGEMFVAAGVRKPSQDQTSSASAVYTSLAGTQRGKIKLDDSDPIAENRNS